MINSSNSRFGFVASLLFWSAQSSTALAQHTSFQSTPTTSGNTNYYAGGIIYDSNSDAFYTTGTTTSESSNGSCFLHKLSNDFSELTEEIVYNRSSNQQQLSGIPSAAHAIESCNLIAQQTSDDNNNLILGGSAEVTATKFTHGFLATVATGQEDFGTNILAKQAIIANTITYPVAMTTGNDDSSVYVVSMTSSVNTDATSDSVSWLSMTTGSILTKYGQKYAMSIEKYSTSPKGRYSLDWTHQHQAVSNRDAQQSENAYIGGTIVHDGYLYVAGTTRGSGNAFGIAAGHTENGFVTRFDLTTGNIAPMRFGGSVARVGNQFTNEVVTNICNDSSDATSFFIVGSKSDGEDNMIPFLTKMTANTLTPQWTRVLHTTVVFEDLRNLGKGNSAYALGCQVYDDVVYIAGTTSGGTVVNGAISTYGNGDVFVAQFDATSSQMNWIKQVGSAAKDEFGGLTVDGSGNAVLYGQTNGNLFRLKTLEEIETGTTDEFALILFKEDGSHKMPIDKPLVGASAGIEQMNDVVPNDVIPDQSIDETVSPVVLDNDEPDVPIEETSLKSSHIVGIVIGAVLLCCVCWCVFVCIKHRHETREKQRKMLTIFTYLQGFDVDDIDIRRSPAGGYHGTYLNNLAAGAAGYGGYNNDDDHFNGITSPRPNLIHASVANDYTFMSNRDISSGSDDDDVTDEEKSIESRESTDLSRLL